MPLIRIRDVGRATTAVHYDGPYEERHIVETGDLLIGMDGDFRLARWAGERALLNQRVCRLRIRDDSLYSSAFLAICIQPYLDVIAEATSSVTVKHLSSRTVEDIPVPLPPRAEQARIVAAIEEHISRLDAADAALERVNRQLVRLRHATIHDVMAGSWPMETLGEFTIDQRYGTSAKTNRTPGVPVLRMGNIVDGVLDFSDLKFLPVDHKDLDDTLLAPGDLLFNRTNSPDLVGKAAVFEGFDGAVAYASYLIRVRLDKRLDPRWAATAINSPFGRRFIAKVRSQQVGQANVNGTKLRQFPIPVPPHRTQVRLLERLDQVNGWASAVRKEALHASQRSRILRRSILAAAFAGMLAPQDPADEPASVLLERIRAEQAASAPGRRRRAKVSS